MPNPRIDLHGQIFGEWTVLSIAPNLFGDDSAWFCKCSCGAVRAVTTYALRRGRSISCHPCSLKRVHEGKVTHGQCRKGRATKLWFAWQGMRWRCNPDNKQDRHLYFDRGLRVCEEWVNDFEAFAAHIGPPPVGKNWSVDRKDNDRGYEPGNVRWATPKQQIENQRKKHK